MQPSPTLDQLQVFLAVVDEGGFSAAARALGRAQSVISYAVAQLEHQLEVALFDRTGTRRPHLSAAGRVLVADARRLVGDLDLLRARVRGLHEGLEGELSVAISNAVPSGIVLTTLHAFQRQFPTVTLKVTVGTLGVVVDTVAGRRANVGFGGMMDGAPDALRFVPVGQTTMVPVAARSHPLATAPAPLTVEDLRDETQLVVFDPSGRTSGRDFNVFSLKTWRVSDNATKHLFIRGGLGWGGLPISVVADDLARGDLVVLPFPAFRQTHYPIFAITDVAAPPGPAARWLIGAVATAFDAPPT